MYSQSEVQSLLERFASEVIDVARAVANAKGDMTAQRAVLGERAVRLAVAELVASRRTKIGEDLPKGPTLNTAKSVMSQARRAVKLAKAADDPIIFAWLDGSAEVTMWQYIREHAVKPDKLAAALKVVTEHFTVSEDEELERFVARIELAREALSNAAEKLIASLNH